MVENASVLLLGYTPDSKQTFTVKRRGYPDHEFGGFHPVCRTCDGYGFKWNAYSEGNITGSENCVLCGGYGWAPFSLLLDVNNKFH